MVIRSPHFDRTEHRCWVPHGLAAATAVIATSNDKNGKILSASSAMLVENPHDLLQLALQVHQKLTQLDLARAHSVSNSSLVSDNPDTYGEEVAYWLDTDNPGECTWCLMWYGFGCTPCAHTGARTVE